MANDLTLYKDFVLLAHETPDLIERIGDCPNWETEVLMPQMLFTDLAEQDGYKLQVHNITGIARLLGPDGKRKAWGSKEVMWEKLQRMTREDFLARGDIVGVSRQGLYDHYCVYLGDGEAIHYAGKNDDLNGEKTVHRTTLDKFLKGAEEYFVVSFVGGYPVKIHNSFDFRITNLMDVIRTPFPEKPEQIYDAEETVKRAESRLDECKYSIEANNCEHFAMWCKTGKSVSTQVEAIKKFVLEHVLGQEA